MVYLTRIKHFRAASKLFNSDWNFQKNEAVLGRSANNNWHDPNYELYATVKGEPNPDTGLIFDVKKPRQVIRNIVLEKIDRRDLNKDVDFVKVIMCGTKNLAVGIWKDLKKIASGGNSSRD